MTNSMYVKTSSILDDICKEKIREINRIKNNFKSFDIPKALERGSFLEALKKDNLSVIAEIKKASPSEGIIREEFDIVSILKSYTELEVDAISVLTDEKFFQGSFKDLQLVRKNTDKPVLRKDFILDKIQIERSARLGADAILLIVSILKDEQLNNLYKYALRLGLDVVVEIHNINELNRALKLQPRIIGINNRNLKTFDVDIKTFENLSKKIPKSIIKVAESGIKTADDIKYIKKHGADAVLVGTSLMQSNDISDRYKEIFNLE